MIRLFSATIFTLLQCLQGRAGIDTLLLFHLSQSLAGRPPQGAPAAAQTPPINAVADKGKNVIRDLNSGTGQDMGPLNNIKTLLHIVVPGYTYRHISDRKCFSAGLCKVRGAASRDWIPPGNTVVAFASD